MGRLEQKVHKNEFLNYPSVFLFNKKTDG